MRREPIDKHLAIITDDSERVFLYCDACQYQQFIYDRLELIGKAFWPRLWLALRDSWRVGKAFWHHGDCH